MHHLKLVLLVALCVFFVGCTAAKQNAATTKASTEWRLQSLEESFLNFREQQRKRADKNAEALSEIDRKLADLEAKMAAVESPDGAMSAPVETSEAPKGKEWVNDLEPEEGDWVDGANPEKQPVAQSDEEKPWNKPPTPANIPEPKVIERKTAKKSAPKKKSTSKKVSGAQALYNAALNDYYAEKFEQARSAFDRFIDKYPKSELVPNAYYWKGETYYSEKNYAQAILTFKEITGRYGKHSKAPDALLKIGMSYDKVGDSDNAIFYLRALIEDFPSSHAAKLGRQELSRLGG